MEKLLQLSLVLCLAVAPVFAQIPARVLIYTRTLGFRHDSIPTAVESLQNRASSINVVFDHTEDPTKFSDEILAGYDALIFLSTTGEVLEANGKAAFQNYLNLGGNFIAIHSASDTLRNETFYRLELGALFDYHPALQNATVDVIDNTHPSTSMLPSEWRVQDEMYNFQSDPREIGATVILAANESSYTDNGNRLFDQGTPHPLAWFQTRGAGVEDGGTAGRSFYTSLGHLNETWRDELFLSHVLGGITWTLQSNTTRATNASAPLGNQVNQSTPQSTSSSPSSTTSGTTGPTSSSSGAVKSSKLDVHFVAGIHVVIVLILLVNSVPALESAC